MSSPDPLKDALKGASAGIAGAPAGETGDLFALPCDDPRGEIEAARKSGLKGGRPKGAQNIATRELREWLLSRGVLPQEQLMKWFLLGPEGMQKALNISHLADAFDRWAKLGDHLGRYFMAPMVPVDDDGKPAPSFTVVINGSTGVVDASGATRPPWEYLTEQNQQVAAREDGESKNEEA